MRTCGRGLRNPASNPVSLARILVYVTAETHRHAGHADVARELLDGSVGHRDGKDNMAVGDQAWWQEYCDQLELVARGFQDRTQPDAADSHQPH